MTEVSRGGCAMQEMRLYESRKLELTPRTDCVAGWKAGEHRFNRDGRS